MVTTRLPWLLLVALAVAGVDTGTLARGPDAAPPATSGHPVSSAPTMAVRVATARHHVGRHRAVGAGDCGAASSTPLRGDAPIIVSLPPAPAFAVGAIDPASFRHPPEVDLSWRLHYDGFMYLPPLAARAAADGNRVALARMAAQLVAFHRVDPDPGSNAYGWDEGTAQRRLQAENCLYELTRDARLVPGMVADVDVQLGWRYYGPPRHTVHNHGLMANLRIVRAGELLGRAAWVTVGLRRMRAESLLAFSPQGTCWEQSAMYQQVDVGLWRSAAAALAADPRTAASAVALTALTNRAAQVVAWLTEPDGRLVQIGDSDEVRGRRTTGISLGRVFRDDAAGYVVGRWSWTDPSTTYYTLRFGPSRRAHGQLDRGSLTWTTAGVRVLVDPGRYDYGTSAFTRWRAGPAAHNVAVPDGGVYRDRGSAWIDDEVLSPTAHRWLLEDSLYGQPHLRTVAVDAARQRLVVTDRYAGASTVGQYWHLDPTWRLVDAPANGHTLVFASGRHRLTVTTNGRLSALLRGSTRPTAGWNFPRYGVRVPAYQISLRAAATAMTTTFVVT